MSETPSGDSTAPEQPATLDNILADVLADGADEAPDTTPTETTPPAAEAAEEESEAQSDDTDTAPAEESEDVHAEQTDTDEAEEPDEASSVEAPSSWSQSDREMFAEQSPAAKEFLLRRHRDMESDYTRKTQELAQERDTHAKITKAIDPHRQMLASLGLSDDAAIQQLLGAQYALMTQPVRAVEQVARAYLGDKWLQHFASGQSDDDADLDDVDPRYNETLKEIQDLKQQLAAQQQSTVDQQRNALLQQVEDFRSTKSEDGTPKYPHFDAVRHVMGALMQDKQDLTMEQAYKLAIATLPEVQQQLIDAAKSAQEKERRDKAKAAKAKVLPKAKSAGATPEKPQDLDSILNEALGGL